MSVTLRRAATNHKPTIANLIQLYLHDMTEFMPFPVGADGRFEYGFLDRFWRHPYFIMQGDEIAGFALVVDECPLTGRAPCWFMAEFFVLKAYGGAPAIRRSIWHSKPIPAHGTSPSPVPTALHRLSGAGAWRIGPIHLATSTSMATTGRSTPSALSEAGWVAAAIPEPASLYWHRILKRPSDGHESIKARIAAGLRNCFYGRSLTPPHPSGSPP